MKQDTGITWAKQLWGKELSFNNILDAEAAWWAASDFPDPTVAIVKHTNACGLSSHPDIDEAYRRAFSGDPVSAYGGIVACNRTINLKMAQEMAPTFYEIAIAPGFDDDALEELKKKKNMRIMLVDKPAECGGVSSGTIWTTAASGAGCWCRTPIPQRGQHGAETVTKRAPTPAEAGRPQVRLAGGQAHQEQRHRAGQG